MKENIIMVAQVPESLFHPLLLTSLYRRASFRDTGLLNECMFAVSLLVDIADLLNRFKDKTALNQATDLYKTYCDCQYIHVTTI